MIKLKARHVVLWCERAWLEFIDEGKEMESGCIHVQPSAHIQTTAPKQTILSADA